MPYKDPDKARENARKRSAKYRATHDTAAMQRAWRARNPGKQAEYDRRWAERNPDKVKAQHARLKAEVIAAYGGQCACCGESEPAFLGVDHVDGSGADHREMLGNRRSASGAMTYRWLKRQGWPQDGFQLLCHNCNMAKGAAGVCPHQLRGISESA